MSELTTFTIRDEPRRDDALWAKPQQRYGNSGKWPDWKTLAKAARELGYEDYAQAWERS